MQQQALGARASPSSGPRVKEVTLLDYGAGNVRSVRNAIKRLGYTIKDVSGRGQRRPRAAARSAAAIALRPPPAARCCRFAACMPPRSPAPWLR